MKYIIDVPDIWQCSYDKIYKTLQLKFCGKDFGIEVTVNGEPYTEPDLNITKDNSVHLCNSCNRMDSLVPCPTTDGDVLFGEDGKSVCCCKLYKPYTIDRKAIDLQHAHDIENVARMNYSKGAEDAWEFATICTKMDGADSVDVFGGYSLESFTKYSYQEAKAKYEAWKKSNNKTRVGDEVIPKNKDGSGIKGEVLRLYQPKQYKPLADVLWGDGTVDIRLVVENIVRTGRHFDEVEELLKKMKED